MVLIKRGGCSFMEKSYNAQDNGAVGAIIYNNDENDIDSNIDMVNDESGRQIDIPVLWLVGRNGHMMVDSMLDVSIQSQTCQSFISESSSEWFREKHSLITVIFRMKIGQLFPCRITIQLRCRQIGRHGTSGDFFNFHFFLLFERVRIYSRSDKLDWCLLLLDMISCGMN